MTAKRKFPLRVISAPTPIAPQKHSTRECALSQVLKIDAVRGLHPKKI